MNEKEYQICLFLRDNEGRAGKRVLKKIFIKAWDSGFRLGDINRAARNMLWAYELNTKQS